MEKHGLVILSLWSNIRKTTEEKNLKHPAMFPIELPKRLIEIFTNSEEQTVFDPFAGIGITLIAAKKLGRPSVWNRNSSGIHKASKRENDTGYTY